MFFREKRVDLKQKYREFYERSKKLIGSATAQQVLNKNDEAWRSFFSLLKAKKEEKLLTFITRINTPGKEEGESRTLWTVFRSDQYRVDVNI